MWDADTLADHFKLGGMGPIIVGGPSKVADELQLWIDEGDLDGFSELRTTITRSYSDFCYAITPGSFEDLVDYLVPELQNRGVHWLDYPTKANGGLTAREGIHGVGQSRLPHDHYGHAFHWGSDQAEGPRLVTGGCSVESSV
jgi:hypothetical protein